MKNQIALFVGNGINNVYKNEKYSWENLLKNLRNNFNKKVDIDKRKPFPLLFEEIISKDYKYDNNIEFKAKTFTCEFLKNLGPKKTHELIKSLNLNNIITSNYDFSLERSQNNGIEYKNEGDIKETKQSLFRKYVVDGCNYWHMHGSINTINTLALGYEHYTSYLQKMRDYVVGKPDYTKREIKCVKAKISNNEIYKTQSWVDLFFTHDIYFIGLNLDFSEITLWYLLNERFRTKHTKRFKNKIQNKLFYFHSRKDIHSERQAKLDLLAANDVKLIPINDDYNNESYYIKCINIIKK